MIFEGLSVANTSEFLIDYDGTVETGIQFKISPSRDLSSFTIYHRPHDGKIRTLEFSEPLLSGDVLEISTTAGSKGVYRTRMGIKSSVLYGVSPYSNWINLMTGPNFFRVFAEGEPVPYSLEYTTKLGGI